MKQTNNWCPVRGVRAIITAQDDIIVTRIKCTWCGRILQPKQRLRHQIEVPVHKMLEEDRG